MSAAATIATHNGTLTLVNPATGGYRTVRIKSETWSDGSVHRVLACLTGPDNESDYLRIGEVGRDGVVRCWGRYRGTDWERLARTVQNAEALREQGKLEVQFAARCRRCDRTLTTPASIRRGIGPECQKMEE